MTDPATSYQRRDEILATVNDRVATMWRLLMWIGSAGTVTVIGSVVSVSMWMGDINAQIEGIQVNTERRLLGLERENERREDRMRAIEAASAAALERQKGMSERIDRIAAILLRIEDKLDRQQGTP